MASRPLPLLTMVAQNPQLLDLINPPTQMPPLTQLINVAQQRGLTKNINVPTQQIATENINVPQQQEVQDLVTRPVNKDMQNLDLLSSDEEIEKIREKVKKDWMVTDIPEQAGYIMDDGSMIDATGKAQTSKDNWKYMTDRSVDHREIAQPYSDKNEPNEAMVDFMDKLGAVRISKLGDLYIDITKKPNEKQMRQISKAARDADEIVVDITDPKTGKTVETGQFMRMGDLLRFLNENFGE